jgi:fumarate reductase subunit D
MHFYKGTIYAGSLSSTIVAPVLVQLSGVLAPYNGVNGMQRLASCSFERDARAAPRVPHVDDVCS